MFLLKIFGDANQKYTDSLKPIVQKINNLENDFGKFSDSELKDKTAEFKRRLNPSTDAKGVPETLDSILPEAFAAVREAAKRTLGQRHFDVQLMGGIVLHRGGIAEMKTGEGKTLVATLPAYLNALEGKGVHLVTVNEYLAMRDAAWMGEIYHALGLTTGCITHSESYVYDPTHQNPSDPLDKERDAEGGFKIVHEFLRPVLKAQAYKADIIYGTNNEYGFDYLRDNLVQTKDDMVQREHAFAIVDEVDSILIDEARTPLIISMPDEDSGKLYQTFARVIPDLKENEDYNVDEKQKAVSITEKGIEKVERKLGMKDIYSEGGIRLVHHLEQALKAQIIFKRDRDYVVKDGEVIIVDEFTGRLMPGRRWSDGLHQAIEAKEDVMVQKESRTLATVTFQNYFRLYKKLAGMTGTARTSAEEFHKVYKLDVVSIPTNKPLIRKDLPDRIYKTEQGKFKAVVGEIKERNEKGQPVLVGTVSIEKNELLGSLLKREGIAHQILNAKNHEQEAQIIAQAGRVGAVTVATNMAGRGVDIILGGNPADNEEAEKIRMLGGLHVVGTERHEARRIDNQLRGRAGRQGDPGSSQFFVSTEDNLARVFGGDRLKSIMNRLGVGDDDVIENKFVSKAIEQAQSRIEGFHFDSRKHVLEYDDVMNKHREAVYAFRRQVLFSENNRQLVVDCVQEYLEKLIQFHASAGIAPEENTNLKEIDESFRALTGNNESLLGDIEDKYKEGDKEMLAFLTGKADAMYVKKEKGLGEENMRKAENYVLLRSIDEIWMEHIETMQHLRDSVQLRAYGQRDPLVEYKTEAQKLFQELLGTIRANVANIIFKINIQTDNQPSEIKNLETNKSENPNISDPKFANVGRNDPCPCGSGLKYKKCHGK